jgi:hypothetical protein
MPGYFATWISAQLAADRSRELRASAQHAKAASAARAAPGSARRPGR